MIPKILHFVWVGDKEKPPLVRKCMESWAKHCPNYIIREWGNDDLKDISNDYVRQAFEYKQWAFVSDYLRLHALYTEGGIYLDTDIELTDNIDRFIPYRFFSGYEKYKGSYNPIISAFMGAEKGSSLIHNLIDLYKTAVFIKNDNFDVEPNTTRISRYLQQKFGLMPPYDGTQTTILEEGVILFPSSYFCEPEEGRKNYAIHHFNGSWLEITAYTRKKIISCGSFLLIRFRKRQEGIDLPLPLLKGEKALLNFKYSAKKTYTLIWRTTGS